MKYCIKHKKLKIDEVVDWLFFIPLIDISRHILDATLVCFKLHLQIPTVTEIIKPRFIKFHSNLSIHPNPLFEALSSPNHPLHLG
jgi:hypothetical protein